MNRERLRREQGSVEGIHEQEGFESFALGGFSEIECFQGLVVEAVRITLALRGGFENPRRDDFSNRRGDAASLK
jgi:hypothetical protein